MPTASILPVISMDNQNLKFNGLDKLQLILLALFYSIARPWIKRHYLLKKRYDPASSNARNTFYRRNGKRLINKANNILEVCGYPEVSRNQERIILLLREGYSLSRIGDGEYSIIQGHDNQLVYYEKATPEGRERLLRVLSKPQPRHLIAMIAREIVASGMPFANARSIFKNIRTTGFRSRMPLFSEFDEPLLSLYSQTHRKGEEIFNSGIFRHIKQELLQTLWNDKDVLFVTGNVKNINVHGLRVSDLFANARSLEMIETVTTNALSEHYDSILESICRHPMLEKKMILLSLGMAATVLAYDLAQKGYHAIDLGNAFKTSGRESQPGASC